MSLTWISDTDKTVALLTKSDGTELVLKKGACITYDGRRPNIVRIDGFTSGKPDVGPIGLTYLPWRTEEKRWATVQYTMRGNSRHLIAHPCGRDHYGEHIDWNTVEKVASPVPPPSGRVYRYCSNPPYKMTEEIDKIPGATCFCGKCHLKVRSDSD